MKLQAGGQWLQQSARRAPPLRRWFTSDRVVQVKLPHQDVVLLRQRGPKNPIWKLTPTLRNETDHRIKLSHGAHVNSVDLIGRRYLDSVKDSRGREVVIHEASMASYIVNSERLATPIYPQDCNTIVSMLDLHPERPGENDGPDDEVFEVFEAGTGMGSLTMHIAKALHAANPPMRKDMREAIATASVQRRSLQPDGELVAPVPGEPDAELETSGSDQSPEAVSSDSEVSSPAESNSETPDSVQSSDTAPSEDGKVSPLTDSSGAQQQPPVQSLTLSRLEVPDHLQDDIVKWSSSRRAVLHTLDRNPAHARGAYKLIRKFRRAIYLPNIDFHIGSIEDYLLPRLAESANKPFLSRAILDLPAPEDFAEPVVRALKTNGLLVVFNPSISQIARFAKWAVTTRQPLRLERVAELPNSFHTPTDDPGVNDSGGGRPWDVRTVVPKNSTGEDEIVQIMRPRVGDRVLGGAFIALFRRLHPKDEEVEVDR